MTWTLNYQDFKKYSATPRSTIYTGFSSASCLEDNKRRKLSGYDSDHVNSDTAIRELLMLKKNLKKHTTKLKKMRRWLCLQEYISLGFNLIFTVIWFLLVYYSQPDPGEYCEDKRVNSIKIFCLTLANALLIMLAIYSIKKKKAIMLAVLLSLTFCDMVFKCFADVKFLNLSMIDVMNCWNVGLPINYTGYFCYTAGCVVISIALIVMSILYIYYLVKRQKHKRHLSNRMDAIRVYKI